MTNQEVAKIGKTAREALDGNLLIGSFAAELVGESYPFHKSQWDIVFENYTDTMLGRKFVAWMESNEKKGAL